MKIYELTVAFFFGYALSYFWTDTPMNRMRIEFPGSQDGIFPG